MGKIKVLVVDDHIIIREGILSMLLNSSVVKVVGEASNGKEAVEKAKELMPDVVLMDLNMPGLDGVSATEQIISESPHIRVLILTVSEDSKDLIEAVKAGARGYLLKDIDQESLIKAIEAVHKGESIINPAMAADLLDEFRNLCQEPEKKVHPLVSSLTSREQEVLSLLAEGLDNKEIAKILIVSKSTVKNHVSNILSKLQLENRIKAGIFAEREGFARQRKL